MSTGTQYACRVEALRAKSSRVYLLALNRAVLSLLSIIVTLSSCCLSGIRLQVTREVNRFREIMAGLFSGITIGSIPYGSLSRGGMQVMRTPVIH